MRISIKHLRDRGVYLAVIVPSQSKDIFSAEELELAAGISNTTRRQEFILGRRAADEALHLAGFIGSVSLPRAPRSGPVWPDGYTGSISHAKGLIGAVAISTTRFRSIGLDLEHSSRIVSPNLGRRISEESELRLGKSPLELFSIKEACYKAARPLSKRTFEFKKIVLTVLNATELLFSIEGHEQRLSGTVICGQLEDHFAAVALLPADETGDS